MYNTIFSKWNMERRMLLKTNFLSPYFERCIFILLLLPVFNLKFNNSLKCKKKKTKSTTNAKSFRDFSSISSYTYYAYNLTLTAL